MQNILIVDIEEARKHGLISSIILMKLRDLERIERANNYNKKNKINDTLNNYFLIDLNEISNFYFDFLSLKDFMKGYKNLIKNKCIFEIKIQEKTFISINWDEE